MEIYKKIYLDEEIEDKNEILNMISEGKIIFNLYLICVNKKNENIFEILECKEIFKEINKDKEYILIGMSYGKEKAFFIIKQIFEEYIFSGQDIKNIKLKFLKNK